MEATPVKRPPEVTFNPDELIVRVSSAAFPMVITFALTPVPMRTSPVVPESKVRADVVVDLTDPAPAKVMAVAVVPMVSMLATPVKRPPEVTTSPEELIEKVSSVPFPMVIVLALTLVPIRTLPVVPESRVRVPVVPELIVKAVAAVLTEIVAAVEVKVKAVAE